MIESGQAKETRAKIEFSNCMSCIDHIYRILNGQMSLPSIVKLTDPKKSTKDTKKNKKNDNDDLLKTCSTSDYSSDEEDTNYENFDDNNSDKEYQCSASCEDLGSISLSELLGKNDDINSTEVAG